MVPRTLTAFWICCAVLSGRVSGQTIQCIADSPERRGEPGCSIIDIRPLPDRKSDKVYWHIDAFETLEDALAKGQSSKRETRCASSQRVMYPVVLWC